MTKYKKSSSACNDRYVCLPPEKMEVGVQYAFSWNLVEQPVEIKNGKSTLYLKEYYNMVIRRLNLFRYCEIIMYPEVSEHGRYHFHGVITLSDVILFFLLDMPLLKHNSSYKISTISDMEGVWRPYMYKGEFLMKPLCKKFELPYSWKTKAKQVALDPLTMMKDGSFSTLQDVYLEMLSDSEEEDEKPLNTDAYAHLKYLGSSKEYDIKPPAGHEIADEVGPNGETIFRKKNI